MRRLTALLLVVVMVFGMATNVFAASVKPEVSANVIKAGEDVTITLTLDEAVEDIIGFGYMVKFDSELFTLKESTNGVVHEKMMLSNLLTNPRGYDEGTYYRISFVDTTSEGQTMNAGVVYTLVFTAKEDLTASQAVAFTLIDDGVMDVNGNMVSVPLTAESLEVKVAVAKSITVSDTIENGTVEADKASAIEGEVVTLTAKPDANYVLEALTVTDEAGEPVTVESNAFTMPDSAVTVSATFVKAPTDYTVTMGENVTVTAGETAAVAVTVGSTKDDVTIYNSFDMSFTYDPAVLELTSTEIEGMSVTESDGVIHVERYGSDLNAGETALTLTFKAIGTGETEVKATSAFVGITETAHELEASEATIVDDTTVVTITGYTVYLTEEFEGESTVAPNKNYTFEAKDKNYDYDVTAKVENSDGTQTEIEVTDNGNGTFTISADKITGNVTITTEKTGKIFDVSLGEDMTGETTAQYMTAYTATLTKAEGYTYKIKVTIDGEEYTGFTYNEATGVVTIPGAAITGKIEFNSNKTELPPETYSVTFEGNGAGDAKGEPNATQKQDYTFTVTEAAGYVYTVTATMNGDPAAAVTKAETANEDGSYTYTVANVQGALVITVEKESDLSVEVSQYVTLNDGKIMYLVTATQTLAEDQALSYDGTVMFYSNQYNAWCFLVIADTELTAETAKTLITNGANSFTTLDQTYDVNEAGKVDINDAQLVYDMYNNEYQDFAKATMAKFLKADVNGSGNIDVNDAAAIVSQIVAAK